LCDKNIPAGLTKNLSYGSQTSLLYGSEYWPIKNTQVQILIAVEMKMIQWMCGYTRLDRIRNEVIREKAEVAPI